MEGTETKDGRHASNLSTSEAKSIKSVKSYCPTQ